MKRKNFIIFLVTMFFALMMGCGNSGDSAALDDYTSDGPAIPDDSNTENVAVNPYVNEQGEVLTQAPNDDIIENDDFGRPPEEDIVPWDEMEEGEEVVT